MDKYTLLTGASEGIGKALAIECAKKGLNVLIVALPGNELEILKDYITTTFKVKCSVLGIDVLEEKSFCIIYNWVKENGFKVNILINNIGIGSKGFFEHTETEFYDKQLQLNIYATTMLSRLFIKDLKANAPSHILNLGSMGGFFNIPGKAVYAASKAYIYNFSRALRLELKQYNINVSVLCPGGTDTNKKIIAINKELKGVAKWSILKPEQVAEEAVPAMLKGKALIIPGFINKFYYTVSRMVPDFVNGFFVKNAFKHVSKHKY